jgi:hypothetical protein
MSEKTAQKADETMKKILSPAVPVQFALYCLLLDIEIINCTFCEFL